MIMHGDCLELLPRVANGSVNLVCADLPYAHMSGGKVRRCTANAWDSPIDLDALWAQLLRVGKRNAAFVFTATQPFATALITSQPKLFRYDLVWDKGHGVGWLNAKKMPLRSHEALLLFARTLPVYNPQFTKGEARLRTRKASRNANYDDRPVITNSSRSDKRYPKSIVTVPSSSERATGGMHPTQKPVALLEWLIRTYSNPDDTVLDPTMGSGTTGVACINTGRSFIGIEKDATYYAIAQRRLEQTQPLLPGAA